MVKDRVDLKPLPAGARRLVEKCLERDPSKRLRDIGDAWVLFDPEEPPREDRREGRRGTVAIAAAAGVAAIALAGLAWVHFRETSPPRLPLHYTIDSVDALLARSTSFAISPDSRFVVMSAARAGRQRLWLRPLDALDWRPLQNTEGASNPFWSPDGRSIGFFDGQRLKKVAIDGGPSVPVCPVPGVALGTWNSDDVILFSTGGPNTAGALFRVLATGGEPSEIQGMKGVTNPVFLPDNARFLYRVAPGSSGADGVYLGSLDGGESRLLIPGGNLVGFAPSDDDPERGYVLFVREATLVAQPFNARTGEITGNPTPPITQELSLLFASAPASVSRSGVIVYLSRGEAMNQLSLYSRGGRELGVIGAPGDVWEPSISPDGRTIAYARVAGAGPTSDIWLWDAARNVERLLITDGSRNDTPVRSHDGLRIVFRSTRRGPQDLWVRAADGSGQDEMVAVGDLPKFPSQWTTDDVVLYSENSGGGTSINLWSIPLSGGRKPAALLATRFEETQGQLSPNGRWIAYTSDRTGQYEVYVAPSERLEAATRVSSADGEQPRWRGDGRELFFLAADGKMMSAVVREMGDKQVSFDNEPPEALFDSRIATAVFTRAFQYDVTKDGQRFVVTTTDAITSRAVPPLDVLVNWQSMLRN